VAEDHQETAEVYRLALDSSNNCKAVITQDGLKCIEAYDSFCDMIKKENQRASRSKDNSIEGDNGKEEEEKALSAVPPTPFDVIILDYGLPHNDGVDVARHILARNRSQRIVIATAYPKDMVARAAHDIST
jgi:CheY-like chemotaxis protein